jgi:O-antigen/teichoic acid export membrane protein
MEKKNIISSLAYKFIERLGVKGLGLIISIVLARLLPPEEFGQIAIMNVFINLSQVIIEGGFTTALIQRKDVTERDYSTVFFINIALACVCFAALQIAAPFISDYYSQDITLPLRVYAASVFFASFNALQLARMQKRMEFRKIMICSLVATIFAGIVGIGAAYCGMGLWALVVYNMMHSVLSCITAVFAEKWLPKFEFSLNRARILFSYGWKMFVSAVLCSLYADVRDLVIGKKFSNNDLAYYNRGQQFPQIISHTLDAAIQSVMFPTMASVQDKKEELRKLLRNAVTMGAYVIIPVMFGLAAVSEPVVQLLLTDKWLPCVPYMQWLCFANAAVPIISSNLIAIKASGRSDVYMRLEMLRRVVMLCILLTSILMFHSVEAIAIGFCISNWIDALIVTFPVKRLLNYGPGAQIADLWKTAVAAGVMFVLVQLMNMLPWNGLILLPLQVLTGAAVYIILGFVLRVEAQNTMLKLASGILGRKKK